MSLLRLILFFLLAMMIRRLFNSMRGSRNRGQGTRARENRSEAGTENDPAYTDLTEQGIDDADFEEIP